MGRLIAAMLATVVVGGLGACGGDDGPTAATTAPATQGTTTAPPSTTPATPATPVPKPSSGKVDADSARVINAWLAALRKGDLEGAAAFFGEPSKVSNATPILTLRTRSERIGFMSTFPCGARADKLRAGERGFTLVTYKLTERKGGDCMGASGNAAYGAIRVSHGRIVEWYRLPDDPGNAQPSPQDDGSGGSGEAV